MKLAAEHVRTVWAWLLLVGLVAASCVSAGFLRVLADQLAPHLRLVRPDELPIATAFVFANVRTICYVPWAIAAAATLAAILARGYSSSRERAELTIALAAATGYHLLLCVWAAMVLGLVVLPQARGI